jgi:hypothetical protein
MKTARFSEKIIILQRIEGTNKKTDKNLDKQKND